MPSECFHCKKPGHFIKNCPELAAKSYGTKTKIPDGYVCYICHVEGHLIWDCPSKTAPKESIEPKESTTENEKAESLEKKKTEIYCYKCGLKGYIVSTCPNRANHVTRAPPLENQVPEPDQQE